MNKMELIDDITVGLTSVLGTGNIDVVKAILRVKLNDYDLVPTKQLPCVDVVNNEDILQRYVVYMTAKNLKEGTIRMYLHGITKFFNDMNLVYVQVTGEIITTYLAMLKIKPNINGKKNSENSIRNSYMCIKQFFDWAYKKGKIKDDVMKDVDVVAMPARKKDRLTDDEVERIRETIADSRESALFELMISTGLRVGEISNLLISDIDFNERSVHVREGKTANAERTVYFSIMARNALQKYLDGRECGYVFISTKGRKIGDKTTNRTLEVLATRMGERANCHTKTTVHIYRKTFASIAYDKTNNMKLVSSLLGHSTTEVTEKCYVVENKEDIKYMARRIA